MNTSRRYRELQAKFKEVQNIAHLTHNQVVSEVQQARAERLLANAATERQRRQLEELEAETPTDLEAKAAGESAQ